MEDHLAGGGGPLTTPMVHTTIPRGCPVRVCESEGFEFGFKYAQKFTVRKRVSLSKQVSHRTYTSQPPCAWV